LVQGTFSTTIPAPIERVWAVVGDIDTHASWSPRPYEMTWTSAEHNQVGSTFRSIGSVIVSGPCANDVEITERVEPTRLAFRSNDPQGVFRNAWDLRPADAGTTEVSYTVTFPKMHGVTAIIAPILFRTAGKFDITKRLAMLQQKVETGA
jgi:uncharacterized protein YndB with AHSA1/START domain